MKSEQFQASEAHSIASSTSSSIFINETPSKDSVGRDFGERVDSSTTCVESPSLTDKHHDIENHTRPLTNAAPHSRIERRTSKGGILSNLLKLDLSLQKHRDRHNASSNTHPVRPTYQLKSIASSRALLQTVGASPQSARSSMYFEDLHKAELGITDDAEAAAQRLMIASEIADILQRQDFIIKMGKSLVRFGAPSHRIAAAMEKVGKRLEIDGSYAVFPSLIIVSFGDVETHTSETHLIKCARSLDMCKLEIANNVAYEVAKGKMDLEEATQLLDKINKGPPTWNPFVVVIGYVLSSASAATVFYNGSWTDCWISAIFGLCVGILTWISEKLPMFGNVFEMLVTIPIAIITLALSPKVCFAAVSMAAIVIPLPGYSLTCSVMELAAKNLVSGSVHLTYALMYVLFLSFGIGYGCSIWRLAHDGTEIDVLHTCQSPVNPWWYFILLPMICIAYGIIFGASLKQWVPMLANSAIGYTVYYFVSMYVGSSSVIAPSVSAFALGCVGNIYARITKRLAFVPLIGGIIVLVPGSLGVKGALHMFDGSQNASNNTFVYQVFSIALSLTLGLFLANLVVYPTGKKRSIFLGY